MLTQWPTVPRPACQSSSGPPAYSGSCVSGKCGISRRQIQRMPIFKFSLITANWQGIPLHSFSLYSVRNIFALFFMSSTAHHPLCTTSTPSSLYLLAKLSFVATEGLRKPFTLEFHLDRPGAEPWRLPQIMSFTVLSSEQKLFSWYSSFPSASGYANLYLRSSQ